MMLIYVFITILMLNSIHVLSAHSSNSDLIQMESTITKFSSDKWIKSSKQITDDEEINAIFVLKLDDKKVQLLEKTLLDRSNPHSKNYGKWLQIDDIKAHVGSLEAHSKVVLDYLYNSGLKEEHVKLSYLGELLYVTMPYKIAKQVLHTEFALFQSKVMSSVTIARITKPYYLPKAIAEVVSVVDDIIRFPSVRQSVRNNEKHKVVLDDNTSNSNKKINSLSKTTSTTVTTKAPTKTPTNKPTKAPVTSSPTKAPVTSSPTKAPTISPTISPTSSTELFNMCSSLCSDMTNPYVLRSVYGIEKITLAASKNSMAVAEFQYQYYDSLDISNFNYICKEHVGVAKSYGGNNPLFCQFGGGGMCTESLMDIEYLSAIAGPIPLTDIYFTKYSILTWINYVVSMKSPPLVHSVSYGNDEIQQSSLAYEQACNLQFMIAGTLGLTIVIAAGDQGVWGRTGTSTGVFNPAFPASSPYVTSVGGTDFAVQSVIGPETTWDCGGGGFSNAFARPAYQTTAVQTYFTTASSSLPASNLYNASGRGYPDISALAGMKNPYCVTTDYGYVEPIGGTSAAAPVIAGIFALLNNARLLAGKSSVGFINPLLYAHPNCFHDVNDGSSNNCNAGYPGFTAVNGWDPATGLGTPDYPCLKALALALN